MDYLHIATVMDNLGLIQEPAFKDVQFFIGPMPKLDGCPLGLFWPDNREVNIPVEANDVVLLHEMGHAYGQYYFNDLSEPYAERWRRAYQKQPVAFYGASNRWDNLPKYDKLFEEGEQGVLEVAFSRLLRPGEAAAFQEAVYSRAIPREPLPALHYVAPRAGAWIETMRMDFTKGADWLSIAARALRSLASASVAYGVYKTQGRT